MKKQKIILDIVMTVLLIIVMGYHLWSNFVHELLGIVLCLLFVIHHIWNKRWYTSLLKGKYTFIRIFQVIIHVFLFVFMICTAFSGIMISRDLFSFVRIGGTSLGRILHLVSSTWLYILMAIHIGLHLNVVIIQIKRNSFYLKYKKILNVFIGVVLICGLFIFYQRGLWQDMFLVTEFKFFDYSELKIHFYFDYVLIMMTFAFISNKLLKLCQRIFK